MRYTLFFLFLLCSFSACAETFESWKRGFEQRAAQSGLSSHVLSRALAGVSPDDRVIKLDRKQPEGTMTLTEYVEKTATPRRVARGRELGRVHAVLLARVERDLGVPRHVLLALWGKETDFGGYTGNFSTITSLATLAFEGRRRDFFETELVAAINLLGRLGWSPDRMKGSWAGAVGQCQFMPSNYLRYGRDGDGNGRVDLWSSMPDVFYSMANMLRSEGWTPGVGWGQRVRITGRIDSALMGRDKMGRPTRFWEERGVIFPTKPNSAEGASVRLYQPDGPGTPSYAIYSNFDVLMRWNRSGYFATAVGRLSDHIRQ